MRKRIALTAGRTDRRRLLHAATVVRLAAVLCILIPLRAAYASDAPQGSEVHLPLVSAGHAPARLPDETLEAALEASLTQLTSDDISEWVTVRESEQSAFALARVEDAHPPHEVVFLARRSDTSGWEVTSSRSAPAAFNAALDSMPPDLVDEGDRAFLRRWDPASGQRADRRITVFGEHYLPWPGGQTAWVMQRDGAGHDQQIDFDILGNAASGQVFATKPGVVAFVKQSSGTGCPSLLCWQQTNMVVIQHAPDEYSWYVHLVPNSVPVRVGDRVGYGALIGVEGETGFASGVHLHYMASNGHTAWTPPDDPNRAPWALGIQAVNFREAAWDALSVGQRYTSQNGTGGSCTDVPLEPHHVALYEHAEYCGLYAVVGPGDYPTAAAFSFDNDRVSSIRVGSSAAAVLCRDEEFEGVCQVFDADAPDLTASSVGNDEASSLKVASRQELASPETPQVQEPAAGALITTTSAVLVWSPAERAVTYQVQAAPTSDFAAPAADVVTASTQITLASLPEGDYWWRVRAANFGELWGEWSEPRSLTLDAAPYRHPYPIAPAGGAALPTSQITFTWYDEDAVENHRLQVYAEMWSAVATPAEGSMVTDTVVASSVYTIETLADGVYYWRVCRNSAFSEVVDCSDFRDVEIDTAPPLSPTLASHAGGAETADNTPTLVWTKVDDASEYNIQVYRHTSGWAAGGKPVQAETLGPLISTLTADTSYTTSLTLHDGPYGWRVRARDAAGNWSEWSRSGSFIVISPPAWLTYLPAVAAR